MVQLLSSVDCMDNLIFYECLIIQILEALTTEKCNERMSLERLELLGDAFLKFAVGRHLFLKHDALDEGVLTRMRSNAVSNSNLYKLAIKKNLQVKHIFILLFIGYL